MTEPRSGPARPTTAVAMLLVALAVSACGTGIIPGDPGMPAGSREWIITVDNNSTEDARLMVAADEMPMGELVGVATPAVVPPKTTVDVVFHVPPGPGWAIFVNPTPQRGPILLAADVPADAVGKLPVAFSVDVKGDTVMSLPADLPGWMGN